MELRVMTFNLRFADCDPAVPHSWPRRRPAVAALLRRESPDLIGTQEGLHRQLREIHEDMGRHGRSYDWIGMGREGGSRGEFMAVFYDTGRLEPVEYEHFWIAPDPHSVGAKWPGAGSPRMVTWVRFRERTTGGEFYALNTHLDNVSAEARLAGARLLVQQMRAPEPGRPRSPLPEFDTGLPCVVTGDFNVPAEKESGGGVYETLLEEGELTDSFTAAPPARRGEDHRTWHDFAGTSAPPGPRIDWILTSPGVRTASARINTFTHDGSYPSDHFPVQATLEFDNG
ncbi:endonuclease/exonuclease/phosphatase family protein [Streptomyces sp. HNM0575]|uniref:endonuclease/exonuclease/phosphatase family protein n=1 Tax=Streptomyces sp. HNM0575 TaxID=2716338 RepID=UPI0016A21EC9|nr:endonuclease/exonuclease/phosphatase family protein [Streptomyces sp. HNM0575]NLU76590.1 endonuclease/exonuclease/phosphatase family protein [Streptomyces sp. HNM0575]